MRMDKLVSALKMMGADEVYDTTFGADLTVMEESDGVPGAAEKGRPLPHVHQLLPGVGEVCGGGSGPSF